MVARDYSGFQAVVNSVERLRETVNIEADKQLSIFRVIRDTQNSQLRVLERMVENLRSRSQTRNNFGFPDRLELKNLKLQAGAVTLTARSVIVETKGGLSREKQSKTESEQLAKTLGAEIKKIKVGSGLGNPLQIFGAGILFQFGAQFAKGFEQTFGKKTGFTFQATGQATGNATADSLQTVQSLLNNLVDTLETKINEITGRNKPIGERILTASETLQKIQSRAGISNNNPYAQKAVNNSITSFQNMLNVFGSGEYSKFFEASQQAINSLTELLGLISSENDLGEFAQDLGELLKIAIAFNGDEFSEIIKQSRSLLTTQKTLEGSSAELIGSLKQALSEQKIIEQGYRLVGRENHKSFFVNDDQKYIGVSNVGGKVLGFTATPKEAIPGVEQNIYEVAFSLDSKFSSLGDAAELTRKELIHLKNSVAEFFNKFVSSVDEAVLIATPENSDQKGEKRTSIYNRFGFVPEDEGDRLVAQVSAGNVIEPNLQFNLKENQEVAKISKRIQEQATASLSTFDKLFQENFQEAIKYAKSIIHESELIQQQLEQLEKEAKNAGYDHSPVVQSQNKIRQNLKNLQARIRQSKRLSSDPDLQNFSNKKITKSTEDPVALIDQYIVYLDQLVQNAQKQAEETVKGIIPNYKNLTIPERKEAIASYKNDVQIKIKEFRKAIEDGNSQLALDIGENILGLVESTRKIYQDLLEAVPNDYSVTPSITANQGYLTSVQNEVLKGQPNVAGKAKTGLMQIVGTETSEGFIKGIEEKLNQVKNSGIDLAESAIEGAKERFGIASPSKVFQEIGEKVVEGFKSGVQAIQAVIDTPIDQALTAIDNNFSAFIDNVQQGFNNFIARIEQQFPIFAELKDLILGLAAGFALNNVLEFLVGQITALADASFNAVLELESMRLALTSVSGSAEAGAKALAFVRKEAQRLGVDLKTAEEAYAGFLAVTRYTALQGEQANRIFSVFQETAARRGLSNEEQGRMFAAINQAISKRKLSAEEVRGQLGEIPGLAFESTVARSLGVNPAQLSEMMSDGLLMAEDIFPKVAALYQAENTAIVGGTETTVQALTRFQNAIVNLQRSFEGWIAPAKIFFNFFAAAIEKISEIISTVVRYLGIFSAAMSIDLAKIALNLGKFLAGLKTVQVVLKTLAQAAVAVLQYLKLAWKELLAQFLLLTLAVDAVSAAFYILSNNAFPELKKDVEEATEETNRLIEALRNLGKETQNIPRDLPKTEEEIVTKRNWNIFGFDTGVNLEGTRQAFKKIGDSFDSAFGPLNPLPGLSNISTLGQQELSNFQENVAGILSNVNKTLTEQFNVEKVIKEIRELDKELTQARSRQFNIPAGDKKRYEAAIKEQQKLIEERDKKLSVTASFETALQNQKAEIEKQLKELDGLVARRGITEDAEKALRTQLEQGLKDIDKASESFNDLMSNLQKSVNALTLALRNLNEQATYFNENIERNTTNARVQFIRRARAAGVGSQVRELGLEEIDQNTLESRIIFLRDQLGTVNELLSKPDFAALLEELRKQAEDAGTNLENTATIDRLINENRSQQETAVLNALKEQLRLKTELGQAEENLEQSISSARSAITDLNQSVEDYFFNLTQQIEEALVETDRILNKLKSTDIRNKLQRALVPGSDTFVNGLIGQIQGIFDRASGILEQMLGQRSARINFAGERRGLQYELENFTRNLGGATEALELFRQGLLGSQPSGVGVLPPPPSLKGRNNFRQTFNGSEFKNIPRNIFVYPVPNGQITGDQGDQHRGVDVFAPVGTPVVNIRSGRIVSAGPGGTINKEDSNPSLPGYQNQHSIKIQFDIPIVVDGKTLTHAYYTHLTDLAQNFQVGQQVKEGVVLGGVGMAGGASHLHLGLSETANFRGRSALSNRDTLRVFDAIANQQKNTVSSGFPKVPFASLIESAARQAGIDPLLFAALIKKESSFQQMDPKNPNRIYTSSAGAMGLSQLMPGTAKELGVNAHNATENLIGGATYLAKMLKQFGGNIELALSAYKAGPGNVRNGQMARSTVQDVRTVMQYYREFQASVPTSSITPSPVPNVDNSRAQELTDRLIKLKENQINLNDASVRQEIEAFLIELQQTKDTILRQMGDSIRTSRQSVIDAQNSLLDARSQYSPQTQSAQLENELRGVENQFRGLDNQLFEQERGLTDNIQGLDGLLNEMKAVLEILSASNDPLNKEQANFLMGLIGQIEQDKAGYSGMLAQIQSLRGELKQGKIDAENFVQAQAKLRTIQADLERIGAELTIAQQQNNLEQERAIALLQSRQQLELDLLQIAQDFEGEDRDKRLALAKEQARLREQEIEYQFQSKKLSQETELIAQRLTIAQNLNNLGKINELELLQSQKQLEQEILEIKKQYPDLAEQELRINFAKEAARQREIQIENNYLNGRWAITQELFDMESRIVEARAEQLEASGQNFQAAALREEVAMKAELLRYEQEIEAIRQRYPDPDDWRGNELIRNATILRDLNLEKIDSQFKNLGETVRDVGVGAFSTFLEDSLTMTKSVGDAFLDMAKSILQSLAQIAARMAISSLFRWMNIGGFADGGTVPNFAEGDTVKSAKIAGLPFKGIQKALQKEGPKGVLAVFTPGEEILSLRTGEAQRYQRLKMQLGKNPLAKIGNFADGGTISDNLLAGLASNNFSNRLPVGFGQNFTNNNYQQGGRSVTVNISAPNPSAFNASERQIGRVVAEYLSRV